MPSRYNSIFINHDTSAISWRCSYIASWFKYWLYLSTNVNILGFLWTYRVKRKANYHIFHYICNSIYDFLLFINNQCELLRFIWVIRYKIKWISMKTEPIRYLWLMNYIRVWSYEYLWSIQWGFYLIFCHLVRLKLVYFI